MADCYFAMHDWKHVIQAYKTTPPHSLDYPDDATSNAADLRSWYQQAIAYRHLNDNSDERTSIDLAYSFPHARKWVSKFFWSEIVAEYKASGEQPQAQNEAVAVTPEQHADALWARQAGYSGEEIELVKYRGRPCHIETYDGGENYQKLTFWYCDADGHYVEAYSFVNGHQVSHYEP